ncbi:prephenate/arogenate dehydrogenase [Lyngbya aestuarii]|uniref:prephenate/arogenate dehydrogenase n=1 Tax=Lyngbya aestuarii TaxID=118322 RepID=UPI00403DA453
MNIGIVGLGLIGGSLGLDLRRLGHQVLGVSRQEQTCHQAIDLGIADHTSTNLSLLAEAQVVFICTPIAVIAPTVEKLIPDLSAEVVLTDVGSVKQAVVEQVAPLWPNFIGGHPMAGTAESGIEAAQPNLFAGNSYVLTPVETTPASALQIVEEIVRSLTTKVYICTPEDHDQAVAWISHLPVMVSNSLIDACLSETEPSISLLSQKLASSGFRDTSRVGGGNPELGVMMARYNQRQLLRSLVSYRQSLEQLIETLEKEDWQTLEKRLQLAQLRRPEFFT